MASKRYEAERRNGLRRLRASPVDLDSIAKRHAEAISFLGGYGAPQHGGECVGCGRIMSVRERKEQGVCDGCAEGSNK